MLSESEREEFEMAGKPSHSVVTFALHMDNRDPKLINKSIKVLHEDVFGEPDGVRSIDCVWRNSYGCFKAWKSFCYNLNTFICGLFIAMCWGCEFATVAFVHIWCIVPCLRCIDINAKCAKKFTGLCCWCLINPCVDAIERLIRVYKE